MDVTANVIIIALALAWFAQLCLSYRQMRRFYNRVFELRRAGQSVVGVHGNRLRRRTYGVLVVDRQERIVHAEQLSGWTVFANLKPVPTLVGQPLSVLLEADTSLPVPPNQWLAFRDAATRLREGAATAKVSKAEESALPNAEPA